MSSKKCYNWDASTNKPSLADPNFNQPCPSGAACCNPGDTCVGNFMCKHKEKATDPNRPDYYVSACTDPNYTSSACVRWCAQFVRTGVVYDPTSDRWQCCGTTGSPGNLTTTCATPSNVSFALVPPEQLPVIGIAGGALASPSSTVSSTSSSSVSTPTTSSAASPNSNGSSGGMSTGTQVGLGIGLGVAFALIIAVSGFVFLRRRRQSKARAGQSASELPTVGRKSHFGLPSWHKQEASASSVSYGKSARETVTGTRMTELPTFDHRHLELPPNGGNLRAELPS